MNEQRLYQVILGPHTTEKSVRLADKHRQVAFKVALTASKQEIVKAVEQLFSVQVEAIQIVKIKGKVKNFKQKTGRRQDTKKAYISLAEGHDINVANFQ